jgi:hypothetical protein
MSVEAKRAARRAAPSRPLAGVNRPPDDSRPGLPPRGIGRCIHRPRGSNE